MRELHGSHDTLLVQTEDALKLFLCLCSQLTEFQGELLALLEQNLFIHVLLC